MGFFGTFLRSFLLFYFFYDFIFEGLFKQHSIHNEFRMPDFSPRNTHFISNHFPPFVSKTVFIIYFSSEIAVLSQKKGKTKKIPIQRCGFFLSVADCFSFRKANWRNGKFMKIRCRLKINFCFILFNLTQSFFFLQFVIVRKGCFWRYFYCKCVGDVSIETWVVQKITAFLLEGTLYMLHT